MPIPSKDQIAEKLGAIKALFAEETPQVEEAPETDAQFLDTKSADGSILRIEPAIEVGATVMAIDESGEMIAAADGDIELESGTVITVEAGIISNVVMIETEEAPEETEEAAKETEEEMSTEKETEPEVEQFDSEAFRNELKEEIIKEVKGMIEAFAAAKDLAELEQKFNTVTKGTLEIVEDLASAPMAEETKKTGNPFRSEKKTNTLLESFTKFRTIK